MTEDGQKPKVCAIGCFYAGVGVACYWFASEITCEHGMDMFLKLCAYAEMAIGGWLIPQGRQ